MTLRLSVISEHGSRLGPHSTKVFGVHGGSIGRGADNEWILPDPERYLSGKHARVDFRAGAYVLVDTSSNGTYVNGAQAPLGKHNDYMLRDGDFVRLGEYELLVTIDKNNDFPPDADAIVAYDGLAPSAAAAKATANDLGAELDVSALLDSEDPLNSPMNAPMNVPMNAESGTRSRNSHGPSTTENWSAFPPTRSEPAEAESATPWHMMTRPLKMEQKPVMAAAAPDPAALPPVARAATAAHAQPLPVLFEDDAEVEVEAGVAAFCRGAGIDLRSFTGEARTAALQLAGQLLRECLSGLQDLTQSNRNDLHARFRVAPPPREASESPLNFARGMNDALIRLLTNPSTRAGSVEAIRDSFKELKAQNAASMSAMHAAFEAFLERVDPKELLERFEGTAKRGVFGSQNKGRYWDLYTEMFAGLVQRPTDGFPHAFAEAFVKTYEARLKALTPPRRSPFGADRNGTSGPDDRALGEL